MFDLYTVIYTTRTISPYENDDIIEKAVKKSRQSPTVIKINSDIGEVTKFGIQVLPDTESFGPIYVAKLRIPGD